MPMTSVRMPEELMDKLEGMSEKLHRSKGWIIKDAVSQYLEKMEQREQMLIETRRAMADVAKGDVVDGDDVMAWLESWGRDNEKEPPKG